jgi:hypothetical protein
VIVLPAKACAEISRFISTEETRYYLNGFLVTRNKGGDVLLVATDSHRMGVLKCDTALVSHEMCDRIIRLSPAMLKACKGRGTNWLTISEAGQARVVSMGTIDDALTRQDFEAAQSDVFIDGTFPVWQRVLPDLPMAETVGGGGFNAKYIESFGKLGSNVSIFQSALGNPALVRVGGRSDFFGVLMPMRTTVTAELPFDVSHP